MASHPSEAAVIITTKNRKDDLRKAVASALMQDAQPRAKQAIARLLDDDVELPEDYFESVRRLFRLRPNVCAH